ESLLRFAVDDAGSVTAVIFGELYRRGEEWKFRAVGQGYAIGLAGLAADFGVDIEDDAAAEAEGSLEGTDGEEQTDAAGPAPAEEPNQQAALEAIPAPRRPEGEAVGPKAPSSRPRTSKKKVTLPKTVKKTLAENDSWKRARLFPVSVLKSDRDREMRATSVLLAVMAQVPEFSRRLTAAFGAPAGRMETFTEVSLPHG
ncbi:TerD family protein, partial [Streptomyces sp. cmx-18-6]|uniref:TerD family protein n=1 Tax=Streptomyces sp. cmx-18-6 TaxID=2790930 RepID=UPI00397FFA66